MRNSVDLPEPEGPMTVTTFLSRNVKIKPIQHGGVGEALAHSPNPNHPDTPFSLLLCTSTLVREAQSLTVDALAHLCFGVVISSAYGVLFTPYNNPNSQRLKNNSAGFSQNEQLSAYVSDTRQYALAMAWSRSAIKSSTFSNPMESLMRLSLTPAAIRASKGTSRCVMRAGSTISERASPMFGT